MSTGKNVAYIRVSTIEQNDERQREALQKYNIDKWFCEKISGKDTHRPILEKMIDFVREGDTIYIHDFSRIARSTKDLLNIIEQLNEKGVNLVSNKENLDCSTATGRLMLTVIAGINQFERENMLERQREGIAIAKREGKYKAHNKVEVEPEKWKEIYGRHINGEICVAELSRELDISRPTAYKLIRQEKAASK